RTTAALSNCRRLEDRLIKLISDSNLKYAAAKGWQVVELYDLAGLKGWSGKTIREHPLAKKMLADLKRGHITGLIFSKLARLARNTRELLELADEFRLLGGDM